MSAFLTTENELHKFCGDRTLYRIDLQRSSHPQELLHRYVLILWCIIRTYLSTFTVALLLQPHALKAIVLVQSVIQTSADFQAEGARDALNHHGTHQGAQTTINIQRWNHQCKSSQNTTGCCRIDRTSWFRYCTPPFSSPYTSPKKEPLQKESVHKQCLSALNTVVERELRAQWEQNCTWRKSQEASTRGGMCDMPKELVPSEFKRKTD